MWVKLSVGALLNNCSKLTSEMPYIWGVRYFVRESKTGYVVIGDNQRIKRHSLFLCKQCVSELHLLAPEFRYGFLTEMSIAAEAVYKSV